MNRELLKEQLCIDEGIMFFPYKDTKGIWTCAIGRNLMDKGLTKDELFFLNIKHTKTKEEVISVLLERGLTKEDCFYLLDNDIDDVLKDLRKNLSWFDSAPEVIQRVLANLCFNIGINRLLEFKRTLAFLKAKKYEDAAREMLNSKWASQVHDRAVRLSNLVKAQANA